MAKSADDWFGRAFSKAWRDKAEEVGRFNLAIFGKTGVGKSTLVNAIFGSEIAATGIGAPVTRDEHLYLHQSGTLGVLDTRGLEVGRDNAALIAELTDYLHGMRRKPLADQLHVAWYCVRSGDRRFEDTEADFISALADLGLPVILVLTQVPRSGSRVHPDAEALAAQIGALGLPIADGLIHYTMAQEDEFTGQGAYGLQELLDATFRSAPSGVEHAITSAQRIDFKRKRDRAEAAIKLATGAATTAGASPIPFSDAAILVPIQLTMMASIAVTYGISVERSTAASMAATAAATTAGRSLVGNLIKFVPGAGTAVAGTINAADRRHLHLRDGARLAAGLRAAGARRAPHDRRCARQGRDPPGLPRGVQVTGSEAQAGMSTRWERIARETVGADYATSYAERFRAMAESGQDIHGEATFIAELLAAAGADPRRGLRHRAGRRTPGGAGVRRGRGRRGRLDARRRPSRGIPTSTGGWVTCPPSTSARRSTWCWSPATPSRCSSPAPCSTRASAWATTWRRAGVVVCGFGLDAAHLPGDCPPTALADVDAAFGVLGLDAVMRYGTWDGDAFDPADGYAVTLLRGAASAEGRRADRRRDLRRERGADLPRRRRPVGGPPGRGRRDAGGLRRPADDGAPVLRRPPHGARRGRAQPGAPRPGPARGRPRRRPARRHPEHRRPARARRARPGSCTCTASCARRCAAAVGGRAGVGGDLGDFPPCPALRRQRAAAGRGVVRRDPLRDGPDLRRARRRRPLRVDRYVGRGLPGRRLRAGRRARGARTLELNLVPSEGTTSSDESRHGPASVLVPAWVDELLAMILEHALLPVRPGREDAFMTAFDEAKQIISSMPGFRGLTLSRCQERPSAFLLLVEWETLEDRPVGFRGSTEYDEWRDLLHDFSTPSRWSSTSTRSFSVPGRYQPARCPTRFVDHAADGTAVGSVASCCPAAGTRPDGPMLFFPPRSPWHAAGTCARSGGPGARARRRRGGRVPSGDQLDAAVDGYSGRVLVLAKSLGTLAAVRAAERGYAAAWLTPLLTEPDPPSRCWPTGSAASSSAPTTPTSIVRCSTGCRASTSSCP